MGTSTSSGRLSTLARTPQHEASSTRINSRRAAVLNLTGKKRQHNQKTLPLWIALLLGLLAVSASAPAAAAAGCSKRVIDDWYADGRVDGTYDLPCYDDAIEELPRDVRDYSSAVEDIQRAMQARLRNETSPPVTADPDEDPTGGGDPGSSGNRGDPDGPTGTGAGGNDRPGDGDRPDGNAEDLKEAGTLDTASSDSIPLPLLVLAGLALLLVAAGSVGYLVRRVQARRVPPTG